MKAFYVNGIDLETITFNGNQVDSVYFNNNLVWNQELNDQYGLQFISPTSFTIGINGVYDDIYNCPQWEGTMEYSLDYGATWSEWDVLTTLTAALVGDKYVLCFRGTGNTIITPVPGQSYALTSLYYWKITGSNVRCVGNIENLLDYQTVLSGGHPQMGEQCFRGMFLHCTALIEAPRLPATKLEKSCYDGMFYGCTELTFAPRLPATNLAASCYYQMFCGCSGLVYPPVLPAPSLTYACYGNMFYGCTRLVAAPELPATSLNDWCYESMFSGCTSLTVAPELPATTMARGCYDSMFEGCKNLITPPSVISATTMAEGCCYRMFYNCTMLKTTPRLPATKLAVGCYQSMFEGCYSLTTIPALPAKTLPRECYANMFHPTINNFTYATIQGQSTRIDGIKMSKEPTDECVNPYRIPSTGSCISYVTHSDAQADYGDYGSLYYMFGFYCNLENNTYKEPAVDITYYTNATVI